MNLTLVYHAFPGYPPQPVSPTLFFLLLKTVFKAEFYGTSDHFHFLLSISHEYMKYTY